MSRGFASNYRIVLLAIGLFACFGGIAARLVCLHVLDREELVQRIENIRRQTTTETARRGDIFDASGAKLATSRPMIRVAIDPWMMNKEDAPKYPELARLLGMSTEDMLKKIKAKSYRTARRPSASASSATSTTWSALKLSLDAIPSVASKAASATAADEDSDFGKAMVAASESAPAVVQDPDQDDADAGAAAAPDGQLPKNHWVELSKNVTESSYAEIAKLGIRGLCTPERRYARVYPHNELAAHIVGFANRENLGAAGIESYAEIYLRGQNGWREGEKDGKRLEVARFETRDIPRSDGYSVVLSINLAVQEIVERELEKIAKTYEPLKATIIVSNPRTGFILAMANYPSFDPNSYNTIPKDEMSRMKNVAVADVYEPGSVFKIVAASAALEEGLVNPNTLFNCSIERLEYRGVSVKLPGEDHHFDHPLKVAEIVAKSSNRGAAQLACLLGDERFDRYARAFGFGRTLGFPVGGEVRGLYNPREQWRPIDTTRMAMGQSVAATALQMHSAMASIANGGVLMKPQVIREIRDTNNAPICQYGPEELNRVISDKTARTMAQLLQAVASKEGTAPEAAIKIDGVDYEVAGKTGTAQKYIKVELGNGRTKVVPSRVNHVVSFVGFFPASRPQVAISVIVDDADHRAPNGVAYGSKVAAPVFRSIGEKLIPILSITPPNQPAPIDLYAAKEGGRR